MYLDGDPTWGHFAGICWTTSTCIPWSKASEVKRKVNISSMMGSIGFPSSIPSLSPLILMLLCVGIFSAFPSAASHLRNSLLDFCSYISKLLTQLAKSCNASSWDWTLSVTWCTSAFNLLKLASIWPKRVENDSCWAWLSSLINRIICSIRSGLSTFSVTDEAHAHYPLLPHSQPSYLMKSVLA